MKMSRTSSNDLGDFHLVFHHWTAAKYQLNSKYKIKQDFDVCLPKFHSASNFKQMCTTLQIKLNKIRPILILQFVHILSNHSPESAEKGLLTNVNQC